MPLKPWRITYSPSNEPTRELRIVDLEGPTTRTVRLPDDATSHLKLYIGLATGEGTNLALRTRRLNGPGRCWVGRHTYNLQLTGTGTCPTVLDDSMLMIPGTAQVAPAALLSNSNQWRPGGRAS